MVIGWRELRSFPLIGALFNFGRYVLTVSVGLLSRFFIVLRRLPAPVKVKIFITIIIVVILLSTPSVQGGVEVLQLPASGEEIYSNMVLTEGRLYKLKVIGTVVGAADGRRFDAQFITEEDPFDTARDSIVVDGEVLHADLMDRENHLYVYYIPGKGREISLRFRDEVAPGVEGGYFDNHGAFELELSEAEFRCWVDEEELPVTSSVTFRYSLDPLPRKNDIVVLEIAGVVGANRIPVFKVDSDRFIDGGLGSPQRLTKNINNNFVWFGFGNVGSYAYRRVPPGIYEARLKVNSGDDVFWAFPPGSDKDFLRIAILPDGEDPAYSARVVLAEDGDGQRFFPYYSPRAAHPIYGPIRGVEGIFVSGEETPAEPTFLYYNPVDRFGRPVNSPAVFYLKRLFNLVLSTLDEVDTTYVYEPMSPIDGVYDARLVEKAVDLRKRLPYSTLEEEKILWAMDNLPPSHGIAASEEELGRIIGRPTVERLLKAEYEISGFPVKVPVSAFDNMKSYDPEDPYNSLYHTFWEVGTRVNAEYTQFTPAPANKNLVVEGKRYDINDADFVALIMAVSYQECGFVHRTQSGLIYRAGKGRGSATGYMQCTADLIKGTNYRITFPSENGLDSVRLGRLPTNSKYVVRNIARCNIEIGSSFLREMLNEPGSGTWHPAFRSEMKGSGVISFGSEEGTINRVKLVGAMYNAGPAAIRVILNDVYDDPTTSGNEGIKYFFGECEGDIEPFLLRFREDVDRYRRGDYRFPIQRRGAQGDEKLTKLIRWLGPYWYKKKAPITWEEAALMKLDIEVIPYVQGLAVNFVKFKTYDDYYFKKRDFGGLWQRPKKRDESKMVIRPRRGFKFVFAGVQP